MPGTRLPRLTQFSSPNERLAFLNLLATELERCLSLNVVSPLWMIPNAGSYTLGVDLEKVSRFVRRPLFITEEHHHHTRRTLIQPVRPIYVRRPVYYTEEETVVRPRRGGGGETKKTEKVYLRIEDEADYTVGAGDTYPVVWNTDTPIDNPSWSYPNEDTDDPTEIKYKGTSEDTQLLLNLVFAPDPGLSAGVPQKFGIAIQVNDVTIIGQNACICGGDDPIAIQMWLDESTDLQLAADDVVTVLIQNNDPTYDLTLKATATVNHGVGTSQIGLYDLVSGIDEDTSP